MVHSLVYILWPALYLLISTRLVWAARSLIRSRPFRTWICGLYPACNDDEQLWYEKESPISKSTECGRCGYDHNDAGHVYVRGIEVGSTTAELASWHDHDKGKMGQRKWQHLSLLLSQRCGYEVKHATAVWPLTTFLVCNHSKWDKAGGGRYFPEFIHVRDDHATFLFSDGEPDKLFVE